MSLERSMKTNSSQTDNPTNSEVSCQIPNRKCSQIQTEEHETQHSVSAEYNPESLCVFLRKVTPTVCSILEKNIKSKAFDRQKILSEKISTSISCLHILEKQLLPEFTCGSLSWNSVGSAVATAYSNTSHSDWCEHNSSVDLWSLNRKDFDPKKPNLVLETDCCISHVSFHPDLPAVIAAGKLSGEILLWDISKEDDPLLDSTEVAPINHREPVTGLHWLQQYGKQHKIEFVSCSLDGKILRWSFDGKNLKLIDGFIILAGCLPRNFEIKSRKDNAEVGITSMSINEKDRSIFIVGLEGGLIFQCSFDGAAPTEYFGPSPIPLKNPINMGFERHKGQVTTVQFSPFSRNTFLSAGSDGELRIYSLLQPKPLMVLQLPSGGINAAQWSTVRPLVFSCVCNSGKLHVWDLVSGGKSPIESVPLLVEKGHGLTLQNNKANPKLMATSCSDGTIQVWELAGSVLMIENNEEQELEELSKQID